ncbi:hypothetical protein ZHAS_00016234 [Anopheles sinensis]|uniref:C2 domain-containing protein n=1 Tax=Anopheles sinensis TaxID=74873 RepID=A0A084WD74_ANOSI|nr:hypothetical protein ZHAS_00016234 [Anopheles sinensis]
MILQVMDTGTELVFVSAWFQSVGKDHRSKPFGIVRSTLLSRVRHKQERVIGKADDPHWNAEKCVQFHYRAVLPVGVRRG